MVRGTRFSVAFSIAGVTFSIDSPVPVLRSDPRTPYVPFERSPAVGLADPDRIMVRLVTARAPDLTGYESVFASGSAWRMVANGAERFIERTVADLHEPVWVARFGGECRVITVYCGNRVFVRDSREQTIENPISYPLDQLLLMYFLADRAGFLLHAAGVVLGGKCYACAAVSGGGKTTISSLLEHEPGFRVLSDDRIVIRRQESGVRAYGTPWPGEGGIARNENYPVGAICLLRKSDSNAIRALSVREAMERLFPVVSIPWYDRDVFPKVLSACEAVLGDVPAFELAFRPDEGVVKLFRELPKIHTLAMT